MKNLSIFFHHNTILLFAIGIVGLVVHIIFFQSINSVLLLPFLFYWLLLGVIYKFSEKCFFIIALVFLIASVVPFLLGNLELAEKLSVWQYLFVILGLIQWLLYDVIFPKHKSRE